MRYRIVIGGLALAACLPALAAAQQEPAATAPMPVPHRDGSWELSVGAGGTYLDSGVIMVVRRSDSSASRIAPGGVVRLGYNLSDMWSLSIGSGVGYTKPATVIQPFGAITWTPDVNWRTSPFITLGGGVTYVSWSSNGSWHLAGRFGGHLGVGVRQTLGERMALRVEVREQVEHDSFPPQPVFNSIGTIGFSWFLGGRRAAVANVAVNPSSVTLASLGSTQQLSASPLDKRGRPLPGRDVVWASSNDSVATVSATGLVTALSNGSATVSAASERATATVDVTVAQMAATLTIAPANAALTALGRTQQFTATSQDANGNPVANLSVTWRSSDPSVASVSEFGVVTAVKNGIVRITAATANGRAAMSTLTVAQATASIAVTPAAPPAITTANGTTQFAAQAMDANGHAIAGKTFAWSTDAAGVATVSPTGLATAVRNGTAQIAAAADGKTGAARLTVAIVAARPQPVRVDTTRAAPLPTVHAAPLVLHNVNFRPNRADLLPAAKEELDRIAAAMATMPDAHWEVAGYTNSIGPRLRNLDLSKQRADNVKAYLVSRGVSEANLTARGYGSSHPIASNRTALGRRQNIRVEIKRLQ